MIPGKPVSGFEVYQSSEFKALCNKFGIAFPLPTKKITITLTEEEMVITQEYIGREDSPIIGYLDTTTLHNEEYRTKSPPSGEDCLPPMVVDREPNPG